MKDSKQVKVIYVDNLEHTVKVKACIFKPEERIEKVKYDRAKKKKEDKKIMEEER